MTIILICALSIAQPDCDEYTARAVIRFEDPGIMCGLHSQEKLGRTEFVGPNEYIKVRCSQ